MLDKIRLHSQGILPAEYRENIGDTKPGMFDTRCCGFLRVSYDDIKRRTLEGESDEAVLEWMEQRGGTRTDEECMVWNCFMMKRGWHDHSDVVKRLRQRTAESGLESKTIETFFDYIDFDEDRDPVSARSWESI